MQFMMRLRLRSTILDHSNRALARHCLLRPSNTTIVRATPAVAALDAVGEEVHQLLVAQADITSKKLRLDAFLASKLDETSRARIQSSIKQGFVTVNGKVQAKPAASVKRGDSITCVIPPLPPSRAIPEPIPLAIVHEDDSIMVVNKAAGMVVHPSPGHYTGTLVNALLHHCGLGAMIVPQGSQAPVGLEPGSSSRKPEEEDDGEEGGEAELDDDDWGGLQLVPDAHEGEEAAAGTAAAVAAASSGGGIEKLQNGASRQPVVIRPGIVHRLDRGTSGLLVVAKTERSHQLLCDQFKARTVDRTYWSIALGCPQQRAGQVQTNISRDPADRKRMAACAYGGRRGRTAASNYTVLEVLAGGCASLVQWKLETGRTHQIRVHAKYLGHPLFGDTTYGGGTGPATSVIARAKPSRQQEVRQMVARLDRPALHALTLGFQHPTSSERLFFESELPADFQQVLQYLRSFPAAA